MPERRTNNSAALSPASSLHGPRPRPTTPTRPARQTSPIRATPASSARRRSSRRKKDAESFRPKLITAQMVSMQCFHYVFLAFLFQINFVFYNKSITIDRIFTDQHVRLWKSSGWADVSAILLASLFGSFLLAIVVEKSKKCLDFSVTLFLLHLMISTAYGGFPTVLDWWIVHVLGTILMVVVGEYLCSLKEMQDIPLLQL